MTRWETFEEYLFEYDLLGQEFNHAAVVEDLGCSSYEATRLIQSYLDAQDRKDSSTLFVLRRVAGTRTSNTMWHVGARALDARGIGQQVTDDLKRRIERVVRPTLRRIGEKNPQALPAAEATVKCMNSAVELMVAMLNGDDGDGATV